MSDAASGSDAAVDAGVVESAAADGAAVTTALVSAAPVVRIVSGSPTDAELAAVHAVIAAALAEQANAGAPLLEHHADGWLQSARQMRAPLAPGPGAWSASRGTRGC